jgi:hypothetical protein
MNLLDAQVEWYHDCCNLPTFRLLVDDWPRGEFRYLKRGYLYYAQHEGAVEFKYYARPGNGYGGHLYRLPMLDGSIAELKGPWSSSASAMNGARMFEHYAEVAKTEAEPCTVVSYTTDPKVWERGYTFYGGVAVTLPVLLQAADITNTHLVVVATQGTFTNDASDEQNAIIGFGHDEGKATGRWKEYRGLESGAAFTFHPSMEADRLVKADKK